MTQAITSAVRRLAAVPFFPVDQDARLEIMRAIADMVGTETLYGSTPQQRLDWLVKAAISAMRTWGGIPELRGLLCAKWKPADGIEAYSSLPGYRPEDSESLALAEHRNRKAVAAASRLPKLLASAECDRDAIGTLIETTTFPRRNTRAKSLGETERELAEAPRSYLTDAEKARRLAELEANLTKGA